MRILCQTGQPTDRPTDRPMDRPGHGESFTSQKVYISTGEIIFHEILKELLGCCIRLRVGEIFKTLEIKYELASMKYKEAEKIYILERAKLSIWRENATSAAPMTEGCATSYIESR